MTWNGSDLVLGVADDLGGHVEVSGLREAIAPLATPLIVGPSQDGDVVTAGFAAEPDQAERDAIDAAVVTYAAGALDRAKKERRSTHSKDFTDMIYAHYAAPQQTSLGIWRSEARHDGLTNRADYIGQGLAWVMACFTSHYAKNDEIDAQATVDDVTAVVWDYAALEAQDPKVDLRTALAIPD